MTTSDFSTLPIRPELLENIASLDYQEMTPIQALSLPLILEGKDVLAQAKTGSGKTAAFAIGILNQIKTESYQTQALILSPTRELADQVSAEIRRIARKIPNTKVLTLCGGKPMHPQLASLERAPHIVVGTPGRILKHLNKKSLNLSKIETLVLDEADRMLDMGFYDDIITVIQKAPAEKQTLLFSATYPDGIKKISRAIQRTPADLKVESVHDGDKIKQVFYQIEEPDREQTLIDVLQHYAPQSSLVFCNRKQQCQELADLLTQRGFHALALHGDLEQFERDQVLVQFSNKSSSILIATDVAARGLDIKDLEAVINFEVSPDPEIHIHRIGRTGRAGNAGLAVSLFLGYEKFRVEAIEAYQSAPVKVALPSSLKSNPHVKITPPMVAFCIHGGRKEKLRPGDVLGALTATKEIAGDQIGKIDIFDRLAYVAITQDKAKVAMDILSNKKIKGRIYKIRRLR